MSPQGCRRRGITWGRAGGSGGAEPPRRSARRPGTVGAVARCHRPPGRRHLHRWADRPATGPGRRQPCARRRDLGRRRNLRRVSHRHRRGLPAGRFAHEVDARLRLDGFDLETACREALAAVTAAAGDGGCIAVAPAGPPVLPFTTALMHRGWAEVGGPLWVGARPGPPGAIE